MQDFSDRINIFSFRYYQWLTIHVHDNNILVQETFECCKNNLINRFDIVCEVMKETKTEMSCFNLEEHRELESCLIVAAEAWAI